LAETKTERLEMRVDPAFLQAVDDWRRRQPDIPPRAEAVRRLVEKALDSHDMANRKRRR
jgi:hypothetical protein